MQNQALEYSDDKYNSAAYLAPKDMKEPQQRQRHGYRSHHITHHVSRASNPSAHAHSIPHHVSGASGPFPIPHAVQRVQYGSDNILQSYEVYVPEPTPDPIEKAAKANAMDTGEGSGWSTPRPKYWVVYIHGGYFRDPKVTASSFQQTLGQLINPTTSNQAIREVQSHIAGYASINYRLAPHEGHPQDDSVPEYERRNAQWPEMMNDVLAALKHLQQKHNFGERYLLVGHSVGATMALLAALKARDAGLEAPMAVAGVCGIYDFEALHKRWPGYDTLTRNAIKDESEWPKASPGRYTRSEYEKAWARGSQRWVLLAQSKNDGLVDFEQAEEMNKVFEEGKDGFIMSEVMEIKGKHNEVWEKGGELARVVAAGVGEMMSIDQ